MKFFIPLFIAIAVIGSLVFFAVQESSKKVVTVNGLIEEGKTAKRIRVGARVSSPEINVVGGDKKEVTFFVADPTNTENSKNSHVKVIYHGLMPDTLKEGRDVIMEGDFEVSDGMVFHANTLNTQCPSKYKPPTPNTNTEY